MSMLSAGLKKFERSVSRAIPHEHSADRRANMYAVRDQMQFYQTQKDELNKKTAEVSAQKHVEQKRLDQKQIRAMRNHYRKRSGLMSAQGETSDKLG
jgi:hypothetical protein